MAKQTKVKEVKEQEYIPVSDPFATETVTVVKKFGNHEKDEKLEGHPNTLAILKNKGLVK